MPRYADTTLTVNLDALAANYRLLQSRVGSAKVAAVVKANAYGMGVIPVAKRLISEGCSLFFVAHLDEAIELREAGIQQHIAVFHGLRAGQEAVFSEYNVVPVLNDLGQVRRWSGWAKNQPSALPAIIHTDTGMNRLGLDIKDVEALVHAPELLQSLDVQLVMSHLVCAGQADHTLNKEQLKRFNHMHHIVTGTKYSLANSAGCFLDSCYHFDVVRPGCALYGVNSVQGLESPLTQVATVTAKILQIRVTDRPTSVGYGATEQVEAGRVLATLPVGYADGYVRHLSNRGTQVAVAGTRIPVVGRVSMDMIVVDITDADAQHHRVGAEVEVLGPTITVDELAEQAGTIGYEVLTSLGQRFQRVYV